MKPDIEFVGFPKIFRYDRDVVITEKLDGTNAQVYVDDTGSKVFAGSRSRWVTAEDDNYGFAKWVRDNREELVKLGPGSHFGEWWGAGIQRRYNLNEKRFSLFNVERWSDDSTRPKCCHVVPTIWSGKFSEFPNLSGLANSVFSGGSVASPGFMNPEGFVIFHEPSRNLYKWTLDSNDSHKGLQ